MVQVLLKGGLGNQMFQYAAAHAFSKRVGRPLEIDFSFLDQNKIESDVFTPREFELDCFLSISRNAKCSKSPKLFRKIDNLNFNSKFFWQKFFKYNFKLDDYFQSEKYFINYAEEVKELFRFDFNSLTPDNIKSLEKIRSGETVSIHMRKGDYLKTALNEIHGTCGLDYYLEAINIIKKSIQNPIFVVFSDDIKMAENELKPYLRDYVTINNINGFSGAWIDMFLMSNCHSNIIANSSYSWWGAYLNVNKSKIVIAPKKWFKDPILDESFKDITPKKWKRI